MIPGRRATPTARPRLTRQGARALAVATALGASSCDSSTSAPLPPPVTAASFGIVHGAELMEVTVLPFETNRARQTQGFHLELAGGAPDGLELRWEIDRPGTAARVRDLRGRSGRGRVVEVGRARLPAGATTWDQEVPLRPGDPTGTWNVRLLVGDAVVVDRPLLVLDPERAARVREALVEPPP